MAYSSFFAGLFMVASLASAVGAEGATSVQKKATSASGAATMSEYVDNAPEYLHFDGRCNCYREKGRFLPAVPEAPEAPPSGSEEL